jgi:hypothetical protein
MIANDDSGPHGNRRPIAYELSSLTCVTTCDEPALRICGKGVGGVDKTVDIISGPRTGLFCKHSLQSGCGDGVDLARWEIDRPFKNVWQQKSI